MHGADWPPLDDTVPGQREANGAAAKRDWIEARPLHANSTRQGCSCVARCGIAPAWCVVLHNWCALFMAAIEPMGARATAARS